MLSTTPVCVILAKYASKSSQRVTNGARPESGKANTELSRADWKPVSVPCTYGDEAESAIRCGMKRDSPCSSIKAWSGPGQPMCTCWPKIVNCLER